MSIPVAKVSVVVDYADGSSQTLEVPAAIRIEVEEEYEEPEVIFNPFTGAPQVERPPTLERLTVSMTPLRNESTGSLYTRTIREAPRATRGPYSQAGLQALLARRDDGCPK